MFERELRQLRADFGAVPYVIARHIPTEVQGDAIKMVRQVNGVTTYLSWAAVGEDRTEEGMYYAASLAAIDAVTDHYNEDVYFQVLAALGGGEHRDCLELVPLASEMARSDGTENAIAMVARWQDRSLAQFESPDERELEDITRGKGGWSAVGHLHAIKEDVPAREVEFMEDFGYVMQLLDDYIDQPADEKEGISTLFTEGHMNGADLERERREMLDDMESLYGRSAATRRFSRLTRAHKRLGDVVNKTGIPPEKILPWYF